MAFNSYDEFRAATTDPARTYEVFYPLVLPVHSKASDSSWFFPQSMFSSTAYDGATSGGVATNHLSALGGTTGEAMVTLRQPTSSAREWYIYGIEASLGTLLRGNAVTIALLDVLWAGWFSGSDYPFMVNNPKPLLRYTDGKGNVSLAVGMRPTTNTNAGSIILEGDGVSGVAKSYDFNSGNVTTLASASEGSLIPASGGVKRLTKIYTGASVRTPITAIIAHPLCVIPMVAPAGAAVYGACSDYTFAGPKPFIRLPRGTDGNFAMLAPAIKTLAPTSITQELYGLLRLQLVEG